MLGYALCHSQKIRQYTMSYIHNFMYIATSLEQVTFIVKPIITEKTMKMIEVEGCKYGKYTFCFLQSTEQYLPWSCRHF